MASEKFSKLIHKRMEQIYFIAEECGLVRSSLEYEKTKADRYPYWNDKELNRSYRYNSDTNLIEITSMNPDKWGNSVAYSHMLPVTTGSLRSLFIKYLNLKEDIIQIDEDDTPKKHKERYYRRK